MSFVSRKDLPVRNSFFQVFTIFVPRQHHHQPENRPAREPVSTPRRFSCQSFVQTLFSVAFALFSVLNFRHFFLLCCEIANYFFLRFPFSLFFSFPLLSLSEKIILSITPLHGLCRLSYVSLVSSVFRKDLPVRISVSEVFTTFVPCQHHRRPENQPVRPSLLNLCRLSYFSLASFAFRKGYPVRNSVSMVFTVFAPCLHHPSALTRPVREPISVPHRFSCQSFVQTLFSIAFALFSAFNFLCPSFCSFFRSLLTLFPVLLPFYSVLSLFHRQRAALFSSPRPVSSFGPMLAFVLLRSARLSLPCLFFPTPFVSSFRFSSQQSFQSVLLYLIGSYSLLCPFPSSLASLLYPRGLALAPLAFSLRLSVWKNFPFHIYINELTLSTLFRDKNDVPKLFLLLAWRILSLPTCSLAINRPRYFSAPLLFLCAEFLRPVLNLIFSVLSKGVSPRYKALNSFPIIMRKRKFFSHHHTSESLYLIPTFNLSLTKQSERSRFFILLTASSLHSAKVNFCTFSGVLNILSEKSKLFIFATRCATNFFLSSQPCCLSRP